MNPQVLRNTDGHRQHVPHRMSLEARLVDSQTPPHFVDPGLILSDGLELSVFINVSAAVAHTHDDQIGAHLERGHQRRAHPVERRVLPGPIDHAAVGFLERVYQYPGIDLAGRLGHHFANRIGREFGRVFARLRAAHPIRHDVETQVREG